MGQVEQVLNNRGRLGPGIMQGAICGNRALGIGFDDCFDQIENQLPVSEAKHTAHVLGGNRLAITEGNRLIEQAEAVTDRAIGSTGNQCHGFRFNGDVFLFRDALEVVDQHFRRDATQIKAHTARQHGHRHLADFGGGEDENNARWRFLKRLQERVERALRQHVNLIDDVDLVPCLGRGIARAVDHFAHVIDAGIRRRIHLDHVYMAALGNRLADRAVIGGADGRLALAIGADIVEGTGDQPRGGGLADTAHAGQHIAVVYTTRGNRVTQGADQRFLTDQGVETLWAVFACKNPVPGLIAGFWQF